MLITPEEINNEKLNFENKFIRSYDRLKYQIRTYINISSSLDIFFSRIFNLITDEICRLENSTFIRYKYDIASKYKNVGEDWSFKKKTPVEDNFRSDIIFRILDDDKNFEADVDIPLNIEGLDVRIKKESFKDHFYYYYRLIIAGQTQKNNDHYFFQWLVPLSDTVKTYENKRDARLIAFILNFYEKINHKKIIFYQDLLKTEQRKKGLSLIHSREQDTSIEKYLSANPIDYLIRIIFEIIRTKVASQIELENKKSSDVINYYSPMGFFLLKAYNQDTNLLLPSFGYLFDSEQIKFLSSHDREEKLLSLIEIKRLENSETMFPATGLCGKVAETKYFQFTLNWKSLTKGDVNEIVYEVESKFLKYNQLYEWPIFDIEDNITYIACLNIGYNQKGMEIPLSIELIEKIRRIIESEFQLNIQYYLDIQEILNEKKLRIESDKKVDELNYLLNHQFIQRFLNPVQKWLIESESIFSLLLPVSEDIKRLVYINKAISSRINMIRVFQDNTQNIFTNLISKEELSLGTFFESLFELIEAELYFREKLDGIKKYTSILKHIKIIKPVNDIKVNIDKNALEMIIYTFISNAIDVFQKSNDFELCKLEITFNYFGKNNDWIIIGVMNSGIIDGVSLSSLTNMFSKIKNGELVSRTEFVFNKNKSAIHSGLSLFTAAKIAKTYSDKGGKNCGHLNVSIDKIWTQFSVILPLIKYS